MRISPILLALLAACTTPSPRPRTMPLAPPPRSWTERDLAVPRGRPADSTERHRPRPGGYPADREAQVFASAVALPPESYHPAAESGRTLRITEIPARRILAALPALGTVPLRTGVWPTAARVVEHDSLGALIATDPVSLASVGAEVTCDGVRWAREVPVRLQAYVAAERGSVVVRPRVSVGTFNDAEPECRVGIVGQDRIAAFAVDVAAALRQSARMGMAVPIRPRP